MEDTNKRDMNFEQSFDINDVSFDNVSREFENRFRHRYSSSLNLMSDGRDRLRNASGANSLGILEKMAQRIDYYDEKSDFQESYDQLIKEYEQFTET